MALAMSLITMPTKAQGSHLVKLTNHLEPYGFFRASAIFDAREVKADAEDLFYYIPYDKEINLEGNDIWYNPSVKMSAVTTRLGVNLTGLRYGSFNVSGKFETDFYLMIGGSASMRLREAYLNLDWKDMGRFVNSVSFKVGHAWNPMSEDMPYTVGYESGSPFNPYSRSPQLMLNVDMMKHLTFTAGALYPMEFQPTGPLGASSDYVKYGLIPELYAGLTFHSRNFTAKAGADFLSLVPRWRTTDTDGYHYDKGTKVNDRIFMISPMAYMQFRKGSFRINAKAVLASGGDHLRLMGGYALYDRSDVYDYKYTPLQSASAFVSLCFGNKWQGLLFAGGMKALGTRHSLPVNDKGYANSDDIYFFDGGFKNIRHILRGAPAVAYNLDRLTLALEYDCTVVDYGDLGTLDSHGVASMDSHFILNHRILGVVKYSF